MTTEPLSVRDEAIQRIAVLIQTAHGASADLDRSIRQATQTVDAISGLLADDTCGRCHGDGRLYEVRCPICEGNGFIRRDDVVEIGPIEKTGSGHG